MRLKNYQNDFQESKMTDFYIFLSFFHYNSVPDEEPTK